MSAQSPYSLLFRDYASVKYSKVGITPYKTVMITILGTLTLFSVRVGDQEVIEVHMSDFGASGRSGVNLSDVDVDADS